MTAPYNHLEGISQSSFLPLPQIRHSKDPRHCQDLVLFKPKCILRGNSASVFPWALGTPGKGYHNLYLHQLPCLHGEVADCPAHSVQVSPPLPLWEVHKRVCTSQTLRHTQQHSGISQDVCEFIVSLQVSAKPQTKTQKKLKVGVFRS